jgi:hypothetical protein
MPPNRQQPGLSKNIDANSPLPTVGGDSIDWEGMWAPYDTATYQWVLEQVHPQDVVVDIGAGDLRLARKMAAVARQVIAIEISPAILRHAILRHATLRSADLFQPLPDNLTIICANAQIIDLPTCVTIGVLLMRHCTSFCLYAEKLRQAGCSRLITNARWRMGVEAVDLQAPRLVFKDAPMGWYACWCGAVGFKEGPVEAWTAALDAITNEVTACPKCERSLG